MQCLTYMWRSNYSPPQWKLKFLDNVAQWVMVGSCCRIFAPSVIILARFSDHVMVGATTGYIMWSMNIVGELEFASIVNANIRYWVCIMRYWRWCICGGRRMGCIMRVASRLPWHRHHCRRARQALQRVGRSDLLVPCQSEVGISVGSVRYGMV